MYFHFCVPKGHIANLKTISSIEKPKQFLWESSQVLTKAKGGFLGELTYIHLPHRGFLAKLRKLQRNEGDSNVFNHMSRLGFTNEEMENMLSSETSFEEFKEAMEEKAKLSFVDKSEKNCGRTSGNLSNRDDVRINIDVDLDKEEQLELSKQRKIESKCNSAKINIKTQGLNSDGISDSRKGSRRPRKRSQNSKTRKRVFTIREVIHVDRSSSEMKQFYLFHFYGACMLFLNSLLALIIYKLLGMINCESPDVFCKANFTSLEIVNRSPSMTSILGSENETSTLISHLEILNDTIAIFP
ncbi:hypothetical protein NPIL_451361 [Nephila pilipes]|uniref:Uncharacterized protein n=1 Tax=Nephila pilipes TaxID=299642 RepID=A0A8X6PPG7_NEPPI|nr:hypothetical protein NPIL_451361 [Nephila pilipes]